MLNAKKEVVIMLWGRLFDGSKEEKDKVIDAIKTITKYPKEFIENNIPI